ncbi:MAG: SDR family oxidoreductase [Chlamydiales bacterium]|nr:SDR family oxidoreductase [Chlamydiales bacterium]
MKVLLTGANGYIGTRLLQVLAEKGHEIIALARVPESVFVPEKIQSQVKVIQGDLLGEFTLPKEIDAAYYLIHSMSRHLEDFDQKDRKAAERFTQALAKTNAKQLIYLTGLISSENLSKHLQSRLEVEKILKSGSIPVTVFRAGIIIGSGSASFEIIRDLTEKLPLMIAPKWVKSRCQPLAVRDVLFYLSEGLGNKECLGKTFDIGGPDLLSYKEMLYGYAKVRGLHRLIIDVPFFTPKLSSYWLIFITSTNYYLARSLVDSMKVDAICTERQIEKVLPRKCLSYLESVEKALAKIEENAVLSSWHDAWTTSGRDPRFYDSLQIPEHGAYKYKVTKKLEGDPDEVFKRIYAIGGIKGYYFMDWAWRFRGLIDRLIGGVGLRRGRTRRQELRPGDTIDFWRVLQIDKTHRILKLYAEMKLPGEAWLEFHVNEGEVKQVATFRPKGLFGRLYWWILYPIHLILFPGMLSKILSKKNHH